MIITNIILIGLMVSLALYRRPIINRRTQPNRLNAPKEERQFVTKILQILPILIGILALLLMVSNFLGMIVELISQHDEMAQILRTELGYSTPDYHSYFFNIEVDIRFFEILYGICLSSNVILMGSVIIASTCSLKRYFALQRQVREIPFKAV